jgi:P27 family predicted phage terminase small subunit
LSFSTAPKHLSEEAKKWWKLVFSGYEMDENGALLLQISLEAFDRMREAQKEVKKDGLIIEDEHTKQKRMHPALRIEKEARSGMLQAWRMLHIDIAPPERPGRPLGPSRMD